MFKVSNTLSLPGYLTIPQDRISMGDMVSETKSFAWFRVQLIEYNLPVSVKTQLDIDKRSLWMKRAKGAIVWTDRLTVDANDTQVAGMLRQEIALMNYMGTRAPQLICFLESPTSMYVMSYLNAYEKNHARLRVDVGQ
jgi:hypothetical protein